MRVGVVGHSGVVGTELLRRLIDAGFTPESVGRDESYTGFDYLFFATPAEVSRREVPRALAEKVTVIDLSSEFRREPSVPLVIPEANPGDLRPGLIANPNCLNYPGYNSVTT